MRDQDKTKAQLISELEELRRQVADLRQEIAGCRSDNQRLELALRESELRHKTLLHNLPEKLFWKDSASAYVSCNHNYAGDFGMTPEQIVGKTDYDLYPPDMAEKYRADDRRIMDSGATEEIEETYCTPAGENFVVRTVKAALKDGNGTVTGILGIFSDITARRKAEEAIREREARLVEAQEVANLGFNVVDLATGRITTSTVLDRIFGIPVDYERTLDKWADLVHPDERQEVLGYLKEVVGEKKSFDREYRIVRQGDKQVRWVHGLGRLQFNEEGQPALMLGTVQDITDRKQAEETLRLNEARFRSLFQDSVIGMAVVVPNGELAQVNPAFCEFLGYSEQELTGKTVNSITHLEDRDGTTTVMRQALNSGPRVLRVAKRYLHKSGQVLWGEVSSTLVYNAEGTPRYFIAQVLDISERKRAEEAILAQNAMLEGIIESTDSPIFSIDREYCYTSFNRSHAATMKAIYGAEIECGRSILEYQTVEEDRITAKSNLDRTLRGEPVVAEAYSGRDELLRPCFEVSHNPIAHLDGNVIGAAVFARDITDRKRAEAALKDAHDELERRVEERTAELSTVNEQLRIFQMFMEASGQGFGMADLNGCITYWNPTLCRLFGEDRPENVVGKHVSVYYSKEYIERRQNEILPALRRDGHWQGELLVYSRQGKSTPILQNMFLIRDEKGKPVRLAAAITDISKLKQAEAALQASEQRYKTLVETSPDGVMMLDLGGHITFASQQALALYGSEHIEEMVGRNPLGFFAPEDHDKFLAHLRTTVKEGITRDVEYTFVRKDGSRFIGEASAALIRDASGNSNAVVAVLRNITERKQTEAALRASEERYELAVRGAGVGIWDWDIRTGKLYFSPRWKTLFGYNENDIGDRLEDWARLLHPDEKDWMLKFLEDFLTGPSPTVTVEYRLRHKDGSYRWIVAHGLAMRDHHGKAIRLVGSHGDITDRKQAEEALHQSHDELRAIYDGMPDGLLAVDIETKRFVRCNASMRQMLGYSKDELLSRSIMDIHPTAELPGVLETFHALVDGGQRVGQDVPVLRNDGSVFHADITHNEVTLDGRRCSVGFFRDVAERKQAQEALRQSHGELQSIYDGLTDGLLIADADTKRFLRASQAMCSMLGYSEDELRSLSVIDIHPKEDLPAVLHAFTEQAAGRLRIAENLPVLRKDGTVFYADITTNVLRYQDRLCVIGFFRDIKERKQAQEALAESEEKYRLLVETTGTGYVILDGEGRIIDANAEYLRISGHRTLEEILGRTVVEWTAPYDVDRNAKEVEKCYRKGFVRQLEIDYVHSDGKIIPIDINATCLDTEDGRQIVCLCRDITERRQAQEAVERERQSLWRMLQASDHERQLISYDIHDGLAQYLGGATMQFQAHDALRENSPDEAQKAYETAVELVRQAHSESRRLISEVRPPVIDEVGIETAISHLVHEHRRHGGPKIDCRSDVQFGRLPAIMENAIYRIAQEALTNACKYSKSKKVKVTMTQDGQEVRLEIQDWGIGFAPESVEKGHFGLDGIRQRVRLLGGRLTIESKPGSGTLVQVVVPILERQPEE